MFRGRPAGARWPRRSGGAPRSSLVCRSSSRCCTSGNPDVTPLGLGNIALAGIFLGLAFYAPGGLWTAFGAHLGWNATLAALDAPVSGLPFDIPLLDYRAGRARPGSPAGAFGPEGGLLATLALTVGACWSPCAGHGRRPS